MTLPSETDRDEIESSRRRKLQGFGALIILAALLAAIVVNSFAASAQRRRAEAWFVHTYQVLLVTGELRSAVHAAVRGQRGFLLTRDPPMLAPYRRAEAAVGQLIPRLEAEIADNPQQLAHIPLLRERSARYFAELSADIASAQRGARIQPARVEEARDACEAVLQVIARIEAGERRLLATRSAAAAAAARQNERYGWLLAAMGALLLLIAAAAGMDAVRARRRAEEAMGELSRSARTDALTGLPNRRFLFERLEIEAVRAARSGAPLSLAIVDVDHFKRINDLHGHPAGDEVLRIVADVAQTTMRASDLVGRIGGEEFAIIMPETSSERARRACERLREAVATRTIRLPGGVEAAITLSTGVALLHTNEPIERLVARADTALYAAKDAGRNQVKLAA